METEIGRTLREARIRRKIDLVEIEDQTKIRVRYLRALENEEWDLLPGPTYTRSFIRTYASFLGLDGERLADDYRRQEDSRLGEPGGGREPAGGFTPLPGDGERRFGAGMVGGIAVAVLIAAILVLGITSDDGGEEPAADAPAGQAAPEGGRDGKPREQNANHVSIRLTATDEVWVCAIAANGTPVIDGQVLAPGAEQGPFRSRRFDLAFGNGSIDVDVNGKPLQVEETPSPVGYRVTPQRSQVLAEGTRPDCT